MGSHLATYLRDHHAGATAGVELARRAAGSNEGNVYGEELSRIADEIAEDRDALEAVMAGLGVRADPIKDGAAWAAEKLGRLKPNGRVIGYSPLSRVVELEGLVLGVTGKLALWESLEAVAGARIEAVDLDRLTERAADQRRRLEALRREAASEALARE
jgi:hypothetical protein